MNYEDVLATKEFGELMANVSKMLMVIAIVGVFLWVLAYVMRKRKTVQRKGPTISRTVFTESHFGMLYNNTDEDATSEHYAVVFTSKGEELCRYEEDEGQTIHGFSTMNNILYMHTTEIDEHGRQTDTKWMYMPEENDFVECE